MESLGSRLKKFRLENKLTIDDFIKKYNEKFDSSISKSMVSRWENDLAEPKIQVGKNIALMYSITFDELVGIVEPGQVVQSGKIINQSQVKDEEGFTEKDRKDIGKRMDEIRKDLTNTDGLMFSGEPLSEEALDSLMDAMEYIVKHTQKVNKKYIPKKYRKENE